MALEETSAGLKFNKFYLCAELHADLLSSCLITHNATLLVCWRALVGCSVDMVDSCASHDCWLTDCLFLCRTTEADGLSRPGVCQHPRLLGHRPDLFHSSTTNRSRMEEQRLMGTLPRRQHALNSVENLAKCVDFQIFLLWWRTMKVTGVTKWNHWSSSHRFLKPVHFPISVSFPFFVKLHFNLLDDF